MNDNLNPNMTLPPGSNFATEGLEFNCEACGQPIEEGTYATFGGNWVPYMPAKAYHLKCISSVPHAGER